MAMDALAHLNSSNHRQGKEHGDHGGPNPPLDRNISHPNLQPQGQAVRQWMAQSKLLDDAGMAWTQHLVMTLHTSSSVP